MTNDENAAKTIENTSVEHSGSDLDNDNSNEVGIPESEVVETLVKSSFKGTDIAFNGSCDDC